jgi:short subunit dehydrogenase-like uncharacterized protein
MVERFDSVAHGSGALVVLASGYDSIPFDLGVLHASDALLEAHGELPTEVTALVTQMRGWLSGGTFASGLLTLKKVMSGEVPRNRFLDPYLLVPQDDPSVEQACRADLDVGGWGSLPRFDADHRAIGTAHVMAPINARIVRRSLALAGRRNCSYAEGMSVGALLDAVAFVAERVWAGDLTWAQAFPDPGVGPSPGMMRTGGARIEFVAKSPRKAVRTLVTMAGDPGYNATSKMLAEAGICLADPTCRKGGVAGGVLTAAAAMGPGLMRRLQAAEDGRFFTLTILDADHPSRA